MAFAYVGVYAKNFACEISEAHNVVTLCSIDRQLAIFEGVTRLEFDNIIVVHKEVEMRTKLAIRIRTGINIKKKHNGFLQLLVCSGVGYLAFRIMGNKGPA